MKNYRKERKGEDLGEGKGVERGHVPALYLSLNIIVHSIFKLAQYSYPPFALFQLKAPEIYNSGSLLCKSLYGVLYTFQK